MPTYDFRCPSGHEFEKFYRKISDAVSELPCPECGQVATRAVSAGAGLLFKGSGFYLTDYGRNAHRKSGGETKSSGGGESVGDAKPADVKPSSQADGSAAPAPASAEKAAKPKESSGGSSSGGAAGSTKKSGGSE